LRRRETVLTILGSKNRNEMKELKEIILQLQKDVQELKNK